MIEWITSEKNSPKRKRQHAQYHAQDFLHEGSDAHLSLIWFGIKHRFGIALMLTYNIPD